eukprot:6058353-Lingulodinium_polyedra.AAC.1
MMMSVQAAIAMHSFLHFPLAVCSHQMAAGSDIETSAKAKSKHAIIVPAAQTSEQLRQWPRN